MKTRTQNQQPQPPLKISARRDTPRLETVFMPASCLYTGVVAHQRYRPITNAFRYRLFMMYLDLDESPNLFRQTWLWSATRANIAWFRRQDHLGDPAVPLSDAVRDLVETRLGFRPQGPIRLLTNLRYWGFAMNPVSFYFCHDLQGQPVAFVAEVNNTPWGEQHCYVFRWENASEDCDGATASGKHPSQQWQQAKEFHVSPFLPMEMQYRWQVTTPGERLEIRIINEDAEGIPFQAWLNLERREWTRFQRAITLLNFPFMTAKVIAAIYWQAARLWWKGAVYYPHP